MEPIPTDLARAALDARERLTRFAHRTAAATGPGSGGGAMAAAANAAIFSDALLAAMHARFQELKGVAK